MIPLLPILSARYRAVCLLSERADELPFLQTVLLRNRCNLTAFLQFGKTIIYIVVVGGREDSTDDKSFGSVAVDTRQRLKCGIISPLRSKDVEFTASLYLSSNTYRKIIRRAKIVTRDV